MFNKTGGTAAVNYIEQIDSGWRYYLKSDKGSLGEVDSDERIPGLEVGDELDYEDEFMVGRFSFGGQVLFEPPTSLGATS